ncbi:MAG TPA: hypothetical protein VFZ85_00890 [Jiangellaceae bacterium]
MNPGRGTVRVWRGLALATASLAVPTVAHIASEGGVPVHGPFLFGAALLSVACVALADRQRTPAAIAAVIGLSQPLVHGVLALSSHGTTSIAPTPRMIVAHALATLVLTVLIAGGEAVLWSMAALARTVLGAKAPVLVDFPPEPGAAAAALRSPVDLPLPRHLILAADSPRRGPPVIAGF